MKQPKQSSRSLSGNEPRPPSSQDGTTRSGDARKLLTVLRAARTQQDLAGQTGRGRGIWLSGELWQSVTKQLETQVSETEALQKQLRAKEQEADQLRRQVQAERDKQDQAIAGYRAQAAELRAQAEEPLAELKALQAQMRAKEEAWAQHKQDLEAQADRLLKMVRGRQDLVTDNQGLQQLLETAQAAQAAAERRAAEAEALVTELRLMHEYTAGKAESGATERDVQALRIRDLTAALTEVRHQADTYRRQLAARSSPVEDLTQDLQRLKADNRRLVALLAAVPEYRSMAAEMAAQGGLHYLPLEECLMARGLVEDLHPQLLDRPVEEMSGSGGAGRSRGDPDGSDPSLAVVLDEQYHWVPRKALEAGRALLRRAMPALPAAQLLALVAELNKVWRDRERQRLAEVAAAHREELRRLQQTFQQRAPYEAVVAGQKINDLKRRMRAQAALAAAAAAAAKGEQRRVEDDSKVLLHAGLSSIQELSHQVASLLANKKRPSSKAAKPRAAKKKEREPLELSPPSLPGGSGDSANSSSAASDASRQQPQLVSRPNSTEQDHAAKREPAGPKYLTSSLSPEKHPHPHPLPVRHQQQQQQQHPHQQQQQAAAHGAAAAMPASHPPGSSPAGSVVSYSTHFTDGTSYRHEDRKDHLNWLGDWCENGGAAAEEANTAKTGQPSTQTHGSAPASATALYGGHGPLVRVNVVQSPAASSPTATLSVWRHHSAPTGAAAAAAATPATTAPVATGTPTRHTVTATAGGIHDSVRITGSAPRLQLESSPAGLTLVAAPALASSDEPLDVPNGGGAGGGGSSGGGFGAAEVSTASLADWRCTSGTRPGAHGEASGGAVPLSLHMQVGASQGPSRAVLPTCGAAAGEGAGGVGGGGVSVGVCAATGGALHQQLQVQLQQQRGTPVRVSVRFPRQDMTGRLQ
ncbi:hypothetical protein Agub_g9213 [Astrephomene gubernaculifera]|uniref:Uncharacterized protein n=1 Tax=Astrephomene gubernaculifera TaxID=47775 RepID=A0AAD3DUR3_9CHLO|nr:hypothetical protein Agub_g9213 [Astrephomene gubernaculifera]